MPSDVPKLEPLADGGFRVRIRFGKERRRFRIALGIAEAARARTPACIDALTAELIGGRPTCGEEQ